MASLHSMSGTDLADVARLAAAGDPESFAVLVRATQADVARACSALVDHASVDDLVQETYLRVFRALPTYNAHATVRTWILGIVRHVCIDEIRRRTRRSGLLRRLPSQPELTHPASAMDLELLIRALPLEQREAFVLTQLVGLRYDEAAAACGCPVGTIRSRVSRARLTLANAIHAAEERAE